MTVIKLCAAEFFVSIFPHLKLELLTQFPASNDEKYFNKLMSAGTGFIHQNLTFVDASDFDVQRRSPN